MRWLHGITNARDMNVDKLQEMVRDRGAWHAAVHGVSKSCTRLGNGTTMTKNLLAMWETRFNLWVGKIPWRRERLPTPGFWPGEFHGLYGVRVRHNESLSLLSI